MGEIEEPIEDENGVLLEIISATCNSPCGKGQDRAKPFCGRGETFALVVEAAT